MSPDKGRHNLHLTPARLRSDDHAKLENMYEQKVVQMRNFYAKCEAAKQLMEARRQHQPPLLSRWLRSRSTHSHLSLPLRRRSRPTCSSWPRTRSMSPC